MKDEFSHSLHMYMYCDKDNLYGFIGRKGKLHNHTKKFASNNVTIEVEYDWIQELVLDSILKFLLNNKI